MGHLPSPVAFAAQEKRTSLGGRFEGGSGEEDAGEEDARSMTGSSWQRSSLITGGFLSHRGTPSYHPFIDGIFYYKPSIYWGTPHFRKPPTSQDGDFSSLFWKRGNQRAF